MKEFEFIPVPSESISLWWEKVERLYRSTPQTWEDFETIESIYEQHRTGTRILYLALKDMEVHFAISGTVQTWPKGKLVILDWCAGREVKKFITLALASLEDFARQVEARDVQFVGREGWKKYLEPYGYQVTHTIYSKRVSWSAPRRT